MQIVIGEGTNVRRPAQTVLAFLHDFKQDDEVTCVHEIQIESICSDAVSYTHLDVYKRQVLPYMLML